MKHSNTLAGFLGIAPLDYGSSFDSNESAISSSEVQETTTINPCSSFPLISNSLLDVEGNVYGTCNDDSDFSDINVNISDDCDSMSLTNTIDTLTDISSMDDTFCDTSSLQDSSTFPDDTFDSAFDDSWSDW